MPFLEPFLAPMLATAGQLPPNSGWAFELKWDGMRSLAAIETGRLTLCSRSGAKITSTFPELQPLAKHLGNLTRGGPTVLDGEITTFVDGRPSFPRLQHRLHCSNPSADQLRTIPAYFMIFDLVLLDGQPVHTFPYTTRRRLLRELVVCL